MRHTLYEGLNPDWLARLHRRIALELEPMRGGWAEDAAELTAQYHASAALPGASKGIRYALSGASGKFRLPLPRVRCPAVVETDAVGGDPI